MKEVVMTSEGFKKLQEELEFLKTVKRKEVTEAIRVARSFGDLSENSEYDDAKNEQAFLEGEILELEESIRNARIIEASSDSNTVSLGCQVVLKDIELRILRSDIGPMLVVLAIGESSECSGLDAEVMWQDEIDGSTDA